MSDLEGASAPPDYPCVYNGVFFDGRKQGGSYMKPSRPVLNRSGGFNSEGEWCLVDSTNEAGEDNGKTAFAPGFNPPEDGMAGGGTVPVHMTKRSHRLFIEYCRTGRHPMLVGPDEKKRRSVGSNVPAFLADAVQRHGARSKKKSNG